MNQIHWNHSNNNELYWKSYTHHERHEAILAISNMIDSLGFISDFHMFSDIEITFRIEIGGEKLNELYKRLCVYMQMDTEKLDNIETEKEYLVNLHTTFTEGTGALKIEVPAVPG